MGISCGCLHLKNTFFDGEERYIEGTTTEIENQDVLLIALLVETVGNRSRCGFVDNAKYIETRNGTCILGGLALRVVEVSGNCDNSILDFFA
mmetsp:Transcript_5403/g.9397  ORF Transcript_5403/g.9397 Transcript_5403/m.9397 type:complete len:92 (-) Transcript_5403:377-652(-)